MSDLYGPGSLDDGCNDMNRTIDYLAHQNTVLSDENSELVDEVVAARATVARVVHVCDSAEAFGDEIEVADIRAALAEPTE